MVRVHVSQLVANHHLDILLAAVLRVAQVALDHTVDLLAQAAWQSKVDGLMRI